MSTVFTKRVAPICLRWTEAPSSPVLTVLAESEVCLFFCSFHDAFLKANLCLLLDFGGSSFIRSSRVPEDVPGRIRRTNCQQSQISGRVVRIRRRATVMGTGERSLRDSRRKTSPLPGL